MQMGKLRHGVMEPLASHQTVSKLEFELRESDPWSPGPSALIICLLSVESGN